MARMLGRFGQPWCYVCHCPAGIDCPDRSYGKRQMKRREHGLWRREAAREGTWRGL